MLLRHWSQAKWGHGQAVLLSGEAGIGKSRLIAALMERLAGEPQTRLRYFCSPQHIDSPFYPIIGRIERAAGFTPEHTPTENSTSSTQCWRGTQRLGTPCQPPCRDVVASERWTISSARPDAAGAPGRMVDALTTQLMSLTSRHPVLMIHEDAHWSDPQHFGNARTDGEKHRKSARAVCRDVPAGV